VSVTVLHAFSASDLFIRKADKKPPRFEADVSATHHERRAGFSPAGGATGPPRRRSASGWS